MDTTNSVDFCTPMKRTISCLDLDLTQVPVLPKRAISLPTPVNLENSNAYFIPISPASPPPVSRSDTSQPTEETSSQQEISEKGFLPSVLMFHTLMKI